MATPFLKTFSSARFNGKSRKLVGTLLVLFPLSCFAFGTWQIHRLHWKSELIERIQKSRSRPPKQLPNDFDPAALEKDHEFDLLKIRGQYDHSRGYIFIGPRPVNGVVGYLLVQPFEIIPSGRLVSVLRGFIPNQWDSIDPDDLVIGSTPKGVIEQTVALRKSETTGSQIGSVSLYKIDVPAICATLRTEPVAFECIGVQDSISSDYPIPKSSHSLPSNRHLEYIITWFSLGLMSSFMLHRRFRRNGIIIKV